MTLPQIAKRLGAAFGGGVLLLVTAVAQLLAPFRLGRLLRAVSLPRLSEHRLRTSLTVLGVAAGVALLVAVMTVNQSVLRGVVATVEDISGKADLEVAGGSSGFNDALAQTVRDVPGVAKVAVTLEQVASLLHPKAKGERVLVVGADLLSEDDAYFREYESTNLDEIKKDPIAFLNSTSHILLGRQLADRLGCALNDEIALATGTGIQRFQIKGFLEPEGIGDAFEGAIAVMDYQAMQIAFSRGHNVDRIDIALEPSADQARVTERLRAVLGDGFTIDPPARKGARVSRMLLGVRSALTMASVIALLVGAFLIYNTMAISVVQRKREIGTLRALGTRKEDVRNLLTLEGALLGVVGSIVGLLLGSLISRGLLQVTSRVLNEIYLQLAASEVQTDPWMMAGSGAAGVVAASLAAALAAHQAGRVSPVQTLRTSGLVSGATTTRGFTLKDAGAVALIAIAWAVLQLPPMGQLPVPAFVATGLVLSAGVLLLPRAVQLQQAAVGSVARWLRLETRLANANLSRDVGRTTTTAGALMVGVSMVIAFGTFGNSFSLTIRDWVKQTLPGDLLITNASSIPGASSRNVPMADVLHDDLSALPEVADVRRSQIVDVPYEGHTAKVIATDIEVLLRHASVTPLEGSIEDARRGWEQGAVAVSENFSRRFDVHRGDTISLSGERGTQPFEVASVIVDYTSDLGSITMDRETYIRAFGDSRVGAYELYLKDGVDPEQVRVAVNQRFSSEHNLFVLTNQEFREDIYGRTTEVFSLLRVLEVVALLVAVLGLVNALLANVLDRVREIGVLRAVGMTRHSVSRLVMAEGVLIGLLGLLSGIVVGVVLSHIMLRYINLASTGWYFPLRFSFPALLELAALTIVASAAGGFYPARKTARLVITDALGYE